MRNRKGEGGGGDGTRDAGRLREGRGGEMERSEGGGRCRKEGGKEDKKW